MVIRRIFFLFLLLCAVNINGFSQANDFCDAVNVIIKDAPNQFRNVKGRMIESNMNAIMWASSIKVPGVIGTRFVSSMGLFYEGSFHQTREKAELGAIYNKYKDLLSSCLIPQGYKLSRLDNFYPGLSEYKKLVFMLEPKDDPKTDTITKNFSRTAPAHVAMEADYSKETGKYTIVMFIFEH